MKHRYLTLSIATGLLLQFASPDTAIAAPLTPVPVANLTVALSQGADPGTADRWVAEKLEHRVIWLDETELDDPSMHAFAIDALTTGRALLVTTRQDRPADAVRRSDFLSSTRRTIYRQDVDGAFASASVPDDMAPAEAAIFMADWLDRDMSFDDASDDEPSLLFDDMPVSLRMMDSRPNASYLPRKPFRKQTFVLANGQSITYDISIVRDLTADSKGDRKLVAVQARMNLRPGRNLAWWNGTFREKKGSHFFIPKSYDIRMTVKPLTELSDLQRGDFQPRNAKPTNQRIDTQIAIQSKPATGIAAGILEALVGAGADPVGALSKLPLVLTPVEDDTTTETKTVSMTVDDYWVSSMTPDMSTVSWRFELSPASDKDTHFRDGHHSTMGYKLFSVTDKLTPMMKSAALETGSVWTVPASWNGKLAVTTDISIRNRVYFDSYFNGRSPFQSIEEDDLAGTRHTLEIDLDSPLLTRTPTVRLQSLSGEGLCLAQADKSSSAITMEECTQGENGRHQQWHLDMHGTYKNRESGQCLAVRMGDGGVEAQTCGENKRQQEWTWAMDRLASKVNGGNQWRLHLRNGKPHAEIDVEKHDDIVWNHHHALLKPWIGYPRSPTASDRIPDPNGLSTPIPSTYLAFKNVTLEERWEARPVTPSP